MTKRTMLQKIGLLVLMTIALLFFADQASAQKKDYKPGETIEWKSSGYPETWEEATFVKATPDGSQPIIREKPNEFHKDGFQRGTSWADIRPLSAKPADRATVNDAEANNNKTASATTTDFGTGLMTQEQVLSFLQTKLGDKPFQNPRREDIKKELAEMIKARGLDFRHESSTEFYRKIAKYGANTSDLDFPLTYNYGEPTKERELMGAWYLGKIGGVVDYVKKGRVYRQNEIGVGNIGTLSLGANGTYVWKSVLTAQPRNGKWRKATKEEMTSEGGDGIVLLKAQGEYDWLVTKDRRTTNKGEWINISELRTRQINEYGSRGGKK
ncbi:MAG: hypothetical protein ABIV48_13005 [Pyrinomonadaceae bacterium]